MSVIYEYNDVPALIPSTIISIFHTKSRCTSQFHTKCTPTRKAQHDYGPQSKRRITQAFHLALSKGFHFEGFVTLN